MIPVFCDNEGCLVPGKGLGFPLTELLELRELLAASPRLRFSLATGRSIPYVEAMTQVLGLCDSDDPAICEGGAALYWPRREKDGGVGAPAYERLSYFDPTAFLHDLREYLPDDSYRVELGKMACLSLYPEGSWTVEQLRDEIRGRHPAVERYSILTSVAAVDITLGRVDKASAVRLVCERMQIPVSQAVAIGDSGNDLPMLSTVGLAACPANATAAVKQVCGYVSRFESTRGVIDILRHVLDSAT